MKRLVVGVLDIVGECPSQALYARVMHANLASVMPQAVSYWCEQAGHETHYLCYVGYEDLLATLPAKMDVLFISSYTESAQLAYALSHLFRQRGAVTVLGGPHARAYPDDAVRWFDYVVGMTDRSQLDEILEDPAPQRPIGRHLNLGRQPVTIPGIRQRWKFVSQALAKSPTPVKVIPTVGSLGCPYTCNFCVDATNDYQPLPFEEIRDDLRFVAANVARPLVAFHDPNFGVRFDEFLNIMEEAAPPGRINYLGESSLSLLSEEHLARMGRVGFKVMLPGVESWFAYGNKSKTGKRVGLDKVEQVAAQFNTIIKHIPYVQANFLMGTDDDEGPEPFELTKEFMRRAPGVFPALYMLTSFGRSAPLNHELQRADRVVPLPFHFLNNRYASNVRPKNYTWSELYKNFIGLSKFAYSIPTIVRRGIATEQLIPRWMNLVRAVSSEGIGRIRFHETLADKIQNDREMRDFYQGTSNKVPSFYLEKLKRDLGKFWDILPPGAVEHDHHTFKADMPRPVPKAGRIALPVVAAN